MRKRRMTVSRVFSRFTFFAVFFASALFLVASANGYYFNLEEKRFAPTGLINLTIEQTPVTVSVNGKTKVYKRTPINLSYLLPDRYDVAVIKEGYNTWRKTFDVHTGSVEINPFITLFLSEGDVAPATEAQINNLNEFTATPPTFDDMDVRANEIWVKPLSRTYPFNVTADDLSLISRFSSPVLKAIWYTNRTHVVFQVDDEIRIMDRDGSNDHVMAKLTKAEVTDFMIASNGEVLVYRDGEATFQRRLVR